MPDSTVIDTQISEFLQEQLSGGDSSEAIRFLEKGFSRNGQIAIASVFVFANEAGVSVGQVLVEASKEWDRNWNFQHPQIRGNPDAPGAAGLQNRASLENIYSAIGVKSPAQR